MKVFEPLPAEIESVAKQTVDASIKVHRALGPGLLESVYETCLAHELRQRGLQVETQVLIRYCTIGFVSKRDCDWIC